MEVQPAAAPDRLALDQPAQISGTKVVCTGIGSRARADRRWASYPFEAEIAAAGGRFPGNVGLNARRDGVSVLSFVYGGSWALADVEARPLGSPHPLGGSAHRGWPMYLPGGQGRFLRFPESGAMDSPELPPRRFEPLIAPRSRDKP